MIDPGIRRLPTAEHLADVVDESNNDEISGDATQIGSLNAFFSDPSDDVTIYDRDREVVAVITDFDPNQAIISGPYGDDTLLGDHSQLAFDSQGAVTIGSLI
ncbi:MAG: hypothetical protein FD138_3581 [Planctomycetota bacterium]|nr:MAG: hypothetical protein FD138_3581 [Planctomycetota bacterium]